MTFTEADVPLRAPPLLSLSAKAVAEHAPVLLTAKYAECPINDSLAGPSSSPIHLPLPASIAIFEALRDQWIKSVSHCDKLIL